MAMDEARCDDAARRLNHLGCLAGRDVRLHGGDASSTDRDVGYAVDPLTGIEHPSAFDEHVVSGGAQPRHAGERRRGSGSVKEFAAGQHPRIIRAAHAGAGYFQRSMAFRCSESAGSSASSMRMPFGSVMFARIAFVGLTRVSDTFAPRCLNMAVAAAMFST